MMGNAAVELPHERVRSINNLAVLHRPRIGVVLELFLKPFPSALHVLRVRGGVADCILCGGNVPACRCCRCLVLDMLPKLMHPHVVADEHRFKLVNVAGRVARHKDVPAFECPKPPVAFIPPEDRADTEYHHLALVKLHVIHEAFPLAQSPVELLCDDVRPLDILLIVAVFGFDHSESRHGNEKIKVRGKRVLHPRLCPAPIHVASGR